ncbi:hypothetical protein [Tenacibaculum xiamenense]|uniref:hypothetical protein n=1 Tax=Tenacibaculum xiamenense TaxID=1261553 RepID=UPI00389556F4
MGATNSNIRTFTIVGIVASILGYSFLIYHSFSLGNQVQVLDKDITTKKNEIEQLESIRAEKVKDLIELENQILEITSTSKDTNTVKKGKELMTKKGIPTSTHFEVTKKENRNLQKAKEYEILGFDYLLQKEVQKAIDAFIKSENSYNSYHQVYEIARYLGKNKSRLADKNSPHWKKVYRSILKNYSWKMPKKYREEFKKLAE